MCGVAYWCVGGSILVCGGVAYWCVGVAYWCVGVAYWCVWGSILVCVHMLIVLAYIFGRIHLFEGSIRSDCHRSLLSAQSVLVLSGLRQL